MLIPMICYNCGFPLCYVAPLYEDMKKRYNIEKTKSKTVPYKLMVDPEIEYSHKKIYEELRVENGCCRAHLMSTLVHNDIVGGSI